MTDSTKLSESASFKDAAPEVKAYVDAVQADVRNALNVATEVLTITRDVARKAQAREERGYLFPLPYTGGNARVRRIPLAKLASITGLTGQMQATVLDVFREIQAGGTFAVRSWQDLERNQLRQEQLANGLCVAGFMDPRLVATEAEADLANDPNVLWVEEIDIRDRLAYLQTVMNPEAEAAKALEPFPEDGPSGANAGESLPAAAESGNSDGAAAGGIQPTRLSAV